MATPAPSFLDATTWTALGEGRYQGTVHTSWYQGRGAFGGVLAGAVLRSMMRELNDVARAPRSLTVHFSAPVTEGEVLLTHGGVAIGKIGSEPSAAQSYSDRRERR